MILPGATPPEGNSLRFLCTVQMDPPAPVEIIYHKVDGTGPERVVRSEEASASHTLTLYLMAPLTGYVATARSLYDPLLTDETRFTTGELPPGAQAAIDATGDTTAPLLGMASPCTDGAYVVILDPSTREVVWYQNFAVTVFGFVDAVTFTEEQTMLVIADGAFVEMDLAGNILHRWVVGIDIPYRVHHDSFRKDGLTYALFSEPVYVGVSSYMLDGFYIFDESGAVIDEWHLLDHFVPPEGEPSPFTEDYSHANSIWVDDDKNVLVSFRHLSAVAEIVGDVADPDFGQITWRASAPLSPFGSDYTITSAVPGPSDFLQQHNVYRLEDGRISMLDNRISWDEPSRALELSLDGDELRIERSYPLPEHCDFQGSVLQTPAGHPLATCAPTRNGYEFDPLTSAIVWQAHVECFDDFGSYIPRFVPLDW